MMQSPDTTAWSSPANIALVKYWGKHGNQLPQNPSISMTLSESVSSTKISWTKSAGKPVHSFLFQGHPVPAFKNRILQYLAGIHDLIPELNGYSLQISSENTFPHSAGISSSASFMSSLALCLTDAVQIITGSILPAEEFYRKASSLARLGSGSASRSVYGGFSIWGRDRNIPGSSDEYAVPINDRVDPVFKNYRDAILVVSSRTKSLSSTIGHELMNSNRFAPERYKSARENSYDLLKILASGGQEAFIQLVEEEAMTLHGLIQTSTGGPILMEPGTIAIIRMIRDYRHHTGSHLCFTLDAGPNVHLLYPESESDSIRNFVESSLLSSCEERKWIDDRLGAGPMKLEHYQPGGSPGKSKRRSLSGAEGPATKSILIKSAAPGLPGDVRHIGDNYPGKLLLFGEYSVLAGSDACAFPLEKYSGRLIMPANQQSLIDSDKESNQSLNRLLIYLTKTQKKSTARELLSIDRLAADINAGLSFRSTIPANYGIGSSGALVAALYSEYRQKNLSPDIRAVKMHLALIESAFHTTSSGTDPLVSYLRKPVFITAGKITCPEITLGEVSKHLTIDLIDSGTPGGTNKGVEGFHSAMGEKAEIGKIFDQEYIPVVNSIINKLKSSDYQDIMDKIFRLTEWQLKLFPQLFPPEIRQMAEDGLSNRKYAIKLCGSGGGGFFLKLSAKEVTQVSLRD